MKKPTPTVLLVALTALALAGTSYGREYFKINFANNEKFDFVVGTWAGNITPGQEFITVDTGPGGTDGGAGHDFSALDLTQTPPEKTFLEITARLLPTHGGTNIRLVLGSNPTDFSVWEADVSKFNTETFTTVRIPLSTAPVYVAGNGANLAKVSNFQVVGDYSGNSDFDIQIESMAIVAE